MNLSELIENSQTHHYNQLHLTDSFLLHTTCRSLNFSVYSATRHRLVLKLGLDETATDCDDLVCLKLDREICDIILATFPSITHLQIRLVSENPDLLGQIAYLLNGWSSQLQSLSIYINLQQFLSFNEDFNILQNSINRQTVLKTLHFCLKFKSASNLPIYFNLPILEQLEKFTFDCYCPLNRIYDSLVNYALPNAQLRTISLKQVFCNIYSAERFLRLDAAFTSKFTSIGNIKMTGPLLSLYAPKFTSLQYLSLDIWEYHTYLSFNRVTALFAAHMPQLEKLMLYVDFDDFVENVSYCFKPLQSVKKLTLHLKVNSHTNIGKHLNPAKTFPKLEKVCTFIESNYCIDCLNERDILPPGILPACRTFLEKPFEECPHFVGPVCQKY